MSFIGRNQKPICNKMKTKIFVLLIVAVFGSDEYENAENGPNSEDKIGNKNTENLILVKIEESEYVKKTKTSEYIGVTYSKKDSMWYVQRRSKNEKKNAYNGSYDIEETAAHASDTLARKLMRKGEQGHKLNFPDDVIEVHPVEKSSKYIGVSCSTSGHKWVARRRSKNEKKMVHAGYFDNEETAAHASDTLARKLIEKDEQGHKLNFPDDQTEVYKKTGTSEYIGVSYIQKFSTWGAYRWSKNESKLVFAGYFDNVETAGYASDTLARKLMKNGEDGHKLNFSDDHTEVYPKEKKSSEYFGVTYKKRDSTWHAYKWSRNEKKNVFNGYFGNEETAAHASDTLARQLIEKGEQGHKLNFPDDHTEVYPTQITATSEYFGVTYNKRHSKWYVARYSKNERKLVSNGSYDNEKTAAHASDTLARQLMRKCEQGHKLNFPDDHTEVHPEQYQKNKRKRQDNFKDN